VARPKGSSEIAGKVRRSFEKAIANLVKGGTIKGLEDIFEQMIAEDPFKAFDVLAKFTPKELMVEVDDARPFAFLGRPLNADEWQKLHGRTIIEHDPDTTGQEQLQ
jgi:hypothetical protein